MAGAMERRQFLSCLGRCALASAGCGLPLLVPAAAAAAKLELGLAGRKVSPWFSALGKGGVRSA